MSRRYRKKRERSATQDVVRRSEDYTGMVPETKKYWVSSVMDADDQYKVALLGARE